MTGSRQISSLKNPLSAAAVWILAVLLLCCTIFYYPRYKQQAGNATLAWDAAGYYLYLPAAFIYRDISGLHWGDTVIPNYQPGQANARDFGIPAENGNVVLKYSSGLAFAELPFFLIGHALAKTLGYPPDGFSLPYQVAIQIGCVLISILGLWLLRRFLLHYYADKIVALLLLLYVIGSNYLNYSAIDGALSHTWLFTLYAGLLLCTRAFYLRPGYGNAAAIGLLCGWATLIRPTEAISCLIPLLWGMESLRFRAISERLRFFGRNARPLVLAIVLAGLVCFIQPLYWKYVSGHWLVYSYGDQGFSWLHPHLTDYAFAYRSGWITYTPLMLLAIFGFIPFLRKGKNRVMVCVFSGIAFYVVSAWDIWWYAGTGGRAMIQYYPVLALPFAAMLEWMFARRLRQWVLLPLLVLFAYLNIWFTWHAHRGSLYDADGGMSQAYYWRVIGRWSAPENTLKLRDGKYLYEGPTPSGARLLYQNALHGMAADGRDTILNVNLVDHSSADIAFAFKPAGLRWLRASAVFHCANKEWDSWKMPQFIIAYWKGNQRLRETAMRPHRFLSNGEQRRLEVDLKLEQNCDADTVKVHFWNPGSKEQLGIEKLEVWGF